MNKLTFKCILLWFAFFSPLLSGAQFEIGEIIYTGTKLPYEDEISYFRLLNLDEDPDLEISSSFGMYDDVNGSLDYIAYFSNSALPLPDTYGDLNSDGKLDFFVGEFDRWSENISEAGQAVNLFPDFPIRRHLKVMDFDNDGLDDVFFYDHSADLLVVQKNLGEMEFEPITIHQIPEGISVVSSLIFEDVDLDGDLDIIVEHSEYNDFYDAYLTVLNNPGNLIDGFSSTTINLDYEHIFQYTLYERLVAGDFNGDGYPDLYNPRILLVNDTEGAYQSQPVDPFPTPVYSDIDIWKTYDVNNDGIDEIIRSGNEGEEAYINIFSFDGSGWILANDLSISFDPVNQSGNTNFFIEGFDFIDYNEDGLIDIISDEAGAIYFYAGQGNLGFAEPEVLHHHILPQNYKLVDIDNDSDQDAVLITHSEIFLSRNNGGSFSEPELLKSFFKPYESIAWHSIKAVSFLDINSDAFPDMFVGVKTADGSEIVQCINNQGTFPTETVAVSNIPYLAYSYVGQYDNDGDPGIYYVTEYDGTYSVAYEGGWLQPIELFNSTFRPNYFEPTRVSPNSFVFVSPWGGMAELTWGQNNGFVDFEAIGTGFDLNDRTDMALYDLHSDGDLDVIYNDLDNFGAENNLEYVNNATFGFSNLSSNLIEDFFERTSGGFEMKDMNGDGFLDIVAATSENGDEWNISLRLNDGEDNWEFTHDYLFYDIDGQYQEMNSEFLVTDINGDGDNDALAMIESSSGMNQSKLIYFENTLGEGCTDPEACNFSPYAVEDNGTCCYGICDCMDEDAYNYNPDADCPINNCTYLIAGSVFHDQNGNGMKELEEPGIGMMVIEDELSGNDATSNEDGSFSIIVDQNALLQIQHTDAFPNSTTFSTVQVNDPEDMSFVSFGLSTELSITEAELEIISEWNGYPCDEWVEHEILLHNSGNLPLSGHIDLEVDGLFQSYQEVYTIAEVNDNSFRFLIDSIYPGQSEHIQIKLRTPNADAIGEFLECSSSLEAFYNDELVAVGSDTILTEMTCAYDPNDKQAIPPGYEVPNYILPGTDIEYIVRFQNTGNAPATDVLIQDTISEFLDLSSFSLRSTTHSVMTFIEEETRVINFLFEGIHLPDSTNNEPESHGLVSFYLNTVDGLSPEQEIRNKAFIYFDNNPPIITNEYQHTIFDCGNHLAEFDQSQAGFCLPMDITLTNNNPYIESYSWNLNGLNISSNQSISLQSNTEDLFTLIHSVSNPICEASDTLNIQISLPPEASFQSIDGLLIAPKGYSYQWYLNGEPIAEANESSYMALENGLYSLEIVDENSCSNISDEVEVIVNSISEVENGLLIYPNPANNSLFIKTQLNQIRSIRIINSLGQEVLSRPISSNQVQLDVSGLPSGWYMVEVATENEVQYFKQLIQ